MNRILWPEYYDGNNLITKTKRILSYLIRKDNEILSILHSEYALAGELIDSAH